MLVNVHLHGRLGHVFGREYTLDVDTPRQVIRALCILKKGFIQHLLERQKAGVGYKIEIDNRPLQFLGELSLKVTKRMDIYPKIIGAKNGGGFEVVLGAILVAVATVVTIEAGGIGGGAVNAVWFMSASTAGQVALTAGMMGLSMIMGGLAQMIGTPKSSNGSSARSYIINGAIATSQQGSPVPIGYGALYVGPIIINAGMDSFQINYQNGQVVSTGTGDGIIVTNPGTGVPINSYTPDGGEQVPS